MKFSKSYYDDIAKKLQVLRPVLVNSSQDVEQFDEYINANELGLALKTVCYYLLEEDSDLLNDATINQIKSIHSIMKVDDECVANLIKKRELRA